MPSSCIIGKKVGCLLLVVCEMGRMKMQVQTVQVKSSTIIYQLY